LRGKIKNIVHDEKYETEKIEKISIKSSAGDIKFEESDDNQIRVVVYGEKENKINVDLYMSVESGINKLPCGYVISNVAIVEDKNGLISYGTGPQFPVPDRYVKDIIKTERNIFEREGVCYVSQSLEESIIGNLLDCLYL